MSERTIKLTIDETEMAYRHIFLISLSSNGIEIRAAGAPIASRDTSIDTIVGVEPMLIEIRLAVEEVQS